MWKDLRTPDLNRRLRALRRYRMTFPHRQGEFIGNIQFVPARADRFTFFFMGERFTVELYFAAKYGAWLDYPSNRLIELGSGRFYPQEVLRVERL